MTPDQVRLFDILLPTRDNDVQPSIRELADAMSTTPSNIHRMLEALLSEGRVERLPGHIRCWRAVPKDPFAGFEDEELVDELNRRGYSGRIQQVGSDGRYRTGFELSGKTG